MNILIKYSIGLLISISPILMIPVFLKAEVDPVKNKVYEYKEWNLKNGGKLNIESVEQEDGLYSINVKMSIPLTNKKYPTVQAAY